VQVSISSSTLRTKSNIAVPEQIHAHARSCIIVRYSMLIPLFVDYATKSGSRPSLFIVDRLCVYSTWLHGHHQYRLVLVAKFSQEGKGSALSDLLEVQLKGLAKPSKLF